MVNISVVSVRSFGWLGIEYVGRGKSVLGNPFVLGRDGDRRRVIQLYRRWLWAEVRRGLQGEESKVWDEVLRLAQLAKTEQTVVLGCWCSPLACHADILRLCLLWLIKSGQV